MIFSNPSCDGKVTLGFWIMLTGEKDKAQGSVRAGSNLQ